MAPSSLQALFGRAGSYVGPGINHEGQPFTGTLALSPQVADRGLSLDFRAIGAGGAVYHREHSLLGQTPAGGLALWVMSSNHPGVLEHAHRETAAVPGADTTLEFHAGDPSDVRSFRETIAIDLWPNGDVSYRYAWGLPGGEVKERSTARMLAGRNRSIPEAELRATGPARSSWRGAARGMG